MIQQTDIHIGNHLLDLLKLPEAARQELLTFYDFLVFKYQAQTDRSQTEKKRILSKIFQEADGVLPDRYTFDREDIHER